MGAKDFTRIPNGTGGLEDRMPVCGRQASTPGRLTKEEFVAVTSANSARILNIYPRKGAVAVGSDADVVIWDPKATKTITAKKQVSRIDYNVFEGFKCTGLPMMTINRGRVAWKEGDLRAEKGDGKYIERPPFPAVHVANADLQGIDRSPRRSSGRGDTLMYAQAESRHRRQAAVGSIMETAAFGATPKGGIKRLTLSDEDKKVRDWFKRACEELGLHGFGRQLRQHVRAAARAATTTFCPLPWALISTPSRPEASSMACSASWARSKRCAPCRRWATRPTRPS